MTRFAFIFVLLASLRAAAAAERVSAGPAELRGPELVVLGRDASIELTLRALPEGARLVTSAGALGAPRDDGSVTRVTLTLPAQRFPQLAIVAVVAVDDSVIDWIALPLAGQANTRVATNPRADVIVRVGDRDFGPVKADASGVAIVPIIVPPGIDEATSRATSASGEREQRVSLGVRAFSRTLAICAKAGDRVTVIGAQNDGGPSRATPTVTASGGALGAPTSVSAGVFVVERANLDAAPVQVRAALPGDEAVAATCELQTPIVPPSAIDIVLDPVRVVAGAEAVDLRIIPRYIPAARRLAIETIAIETDAGAISSPAREADGTWVATWRVAQRLDTKRRAQISARATVDGGATVAGHLAVTIAPAAPARLDARVPAAVRADGRVTSIELRLRDRFGNPVDKAPIEVWRGSEKLATVTSSAAARFEYRPPRAYERGEDTLTLRAPGIESRAIVPLEPLPGPFAIAAHVGLLTNFGRITTPMLRLEGGAYLPVLGDRLSAQISAGVYSRQISAAAMDESLDARITVLPLLANVAYHASVATLDVRAGLGVGAALAWSRISAPSTGTQRERNTTFAATGFLGAARTAGPGRIVGDVAYLHANVDGILAGRIGGIAVTLGYGVDL